MKKAKEEGLTEDITSLQAEIKQRVAEIVKKWGKKEQVVRKRVHNSTTYKSNRAPSIYNAIVSHVARLFNDGKGMRTTL